MYKNAGHLRRPTVFLFTEAEIKDEVSAQLLLWLATLMIVSWLLVCDDDHDCYRTCSFLQPNPLSRAWHIIVLRGVCVVYCA